MPEALKKIREGELTAIVDQLPEKQVANAIGALVSHLKDKKPLEFLIGSGTKSYCLIGQSLPQPPEIAELLSFASRCTALNSFVTFRHC